MEKLTAAERLKYEILNYDEPTKTRPIYNANEWENFSEDAKLDIIDDYIAGCSSRVPRAYYGSYNFETRLISFRDCYIVFPWRFAYAAPFRTDQIDLAEYADEYGRPLYQVEEGRRQQRMDDYQLTTLIARHTGLDLVQNVLEYL